MRASHIGALLLVFVLSISPAQGSNEAELLAPLASDHWSTRLLRNLRFAPRKEQPAPHFSGKTRLDGALHFARWIERGVPSPKARPRLLASEYRESLIALGISAQEVARALHRLAPLATLPDEDSVSHSPQSKKTRLLLDQSLSEFRQLEDRIQRLQAQRK